MTYICPFLGIPEVASLLAAYFFALGWRPVRAVARRWAIVTLLEADRPRGGKPVDLRQAGDGIRWCSTRKRTGRTSPASKVEALLAAPVAKPARRPTPRALPQASEPNPAVALAPATRIGEMLGHQQPSTTVRSLPPMTLRAAPFVEGAHGRRPWLPHGRRVLSGGVGRRGRRRAVMGWRARGGRWRDAGHRRPSTTKRYGRRPALVPWALA